MTWTDPSSHIWAVSELVTAANMNTFIQANLTAIGSGLVAATVTNQENTSNTTYGDLVTFGPAVTLVVPPSGKVLVRVGAAMSGAAQNNVVYMSYALSGSSARGALDSTAAIMTNGGLASQVQRCSAEWTETMNPGSTTFTAKYRATGTSGGQWANRVISVQAIWS